MSTRWVSLGMCLSFGALLASACGSEDGKKKAPTKYTSGGDDNGAGSSSKPTDGGDSQGGSGASAAGGSGATGGTLGDAGSGAESHAGVSSAGGGAGGATPGDNCPAGFDDCDGDASDCETPVNTLTQCGGCDVSCSDSHGTVACTDNKCVMTACANGYGDCDADGTTGCEESLAENDAHCGDCLRDCAAHGAVCNTSMCTPVVVDAAAPGFASYLTSDAIYLMNSSSMPVGAYTLSRIPLDGSPRTQVWTGTGNVGTRGVWADETDVYWAVSGTPPSVLRKPVTAASDDLYEVVFQPDGQPHFLTAQGANFYWASNKNGTSGGTGFIYARSKTAASNIKGTAIVSVDQGIFTSFVVSPTTMYWVTSQGGGELRMAPIAGGTPTPVPDAVIGTNGATYLDGETLYFVRSIVSNALNGVYSYKAGDTTVKQLVAANNIVAVIADASFIYYKLGGDYHVYRAKLTGSAGVAIANGVNGGLFTGQDDTFIYQIYPWGSSGPAQAIIK